MKSFEYADETISDKELMIAVPSIIIGVGILTLPKELAEDTIAVDGWIPIFITGLFFIGYAWLLTKLASMFPHQSFINFASSLVTKPIAIVFTFLLALEGIFISGVVIRAISDIAKEYLFDRTPIEVISLTFLLVVVYAISGSRAGLFRINMMFFPIIISIILIVGIFSINSFDVTNYLPVFKTDVSGFVHSTKTSLFAYSGPFILLLYTSLVRNPKSAPKRAAYGMSIVPLMYIIIYFMCVGVFGYTATANVNYPIIELAKEIEIPGGFFERFDSIFFVIWIMAIFNTITMGLDAAVFALESIFKLKKMQLLYILSPLLFLIGMLPADILAVKRFSEFVSIYGLIIKTLIILVLLFMVKIKKRTKSKQTGKTKK